MDKLKDKILKDYLLGKCSDKATREVYRWISDSDENAEWLFRIEEMYHSGKLNEYADPVHVQQAELRLLTRIHAEERRSRAHRVYTLFKYAAVITTIIFVGALAVYQYNKVDMLEVAASTEVRRITLTDGTNVWLNKHSRVKYPERFAKNVRSIELEGEAMFMVAKDEHKPFIVRSNNVQTRVLGTVFNFNTRGADNCEEVTLQKGKVEVEGLNGGGKIILRPNQKAILDKNSNMMEVEDVYAPLSSVWHNGLIPFRNMRVSQIMTILEKIYDVKIEVHGISRTATYSGEIKRLDDIVSVLKDLSYTIPFNFKVNGAAITLIPRE